MYQLTLDELEKAADEMLQKSKESEKLDPEDIAEDAEDETEVEDTEDTEAEDGGDDEEEETEEDVKKSIDVESFSDDGSVSETMGALVEIFAKSLGDVMENVTSSREFSESSSTVLAKSLLAQNVTLNQQKAELERTNRRLAKLSKSISQQLEDLSDKIDEISAQPAHLRKSVASYTERDFKGSLEGSEQQQLPQKLSKASAVSILNNELMSGSKIVLVDDIIAVESGAPVRGEIRALLESKSAQ